MNVPRSSRAAFLLCFLVLWISIGCSSGEPVREDRTIRFSGAGNAVGFQHGQDGVYIADRKNGSLRKIFTPDENTLAVSTPLWAPDSKRVIFTTARNGEERSEQQSISFRQEWDENPDGRMFTKRAVVFTCWLQEQAREEELSKPAKLFEAKCDHVGYIAANLAVRWHPAKNQICYIDQTASNRHGLFSFDLKTEHIQRIFPHDVGSLIFDWTNNGSHLVCVVGDDEKVNSVNGIWIGIPDREEWWHVPGSDFLNIENRNSIIETLRWMRPTFADDGNRFLFVSQKPKTPEVKPNAAESKSNRFVLSRGDIAVRKADVLFESEQRLSDPRWSPNEEHFGFVQGTTRPTLHVTDSDGNISKPVNDKPVRRFAGWDSTGQHLAYVAQESMPDVAQETWAFLFVPNPSGRDVVYLTDGKGSTPGRSIFSGMRVSFPHWSPDEKKLSMWATFVPKYRSWLSFLFNFGLRPGDPAAILDVETGDINWMAVNADEKSQIGNYHLLKGNFQEAKRWYEEAEQGYPEPKQISLEDVFEAPRGLRRFAFFHYYCLAKLGLRREAEQKLKQFRELSEPIMPDENSESERFSRFTRQLLEQQGSEFLIQFAQDLYCAEVFLSLDAVDDGAMFFRTQLNQARGETQKLSYSLVLSQFLLKQNQYEKYTELATQNLAPLLIDRLNDLSHEKSSQNNFVDSITGQILIFSGGLALLPMYVENFLEIIPDDTLIALVTRWEAMRERTRNDATRLGVDLFLKAGYSQIGNQIDAKQSEQRIRNNPERQRLLTDGGVLELVKDLRKHTTRMAE